MRWSGIIIGVLVALASPAVAASLDPEAVNRAELGARPVDGISPAMVKAQVLLSRAGFSPGIIDGQGGENVGLAIAAFRAAHGLKSGEKLDAEVFGKLAEGGGEPVVRDYTITAPDTAGPFLEKLPARMEDMTTLPHLGFTSPRELLAEKFHMSEELLDALNPDGAFDRVGAVIRVANPARPAARAKVAKIEVDKARKTVRLLDQAGKVVAFYPATVGSEAKPAPSGTLKITRIARNPSYTYNPEYEFKRVKAQEPFTIKPGPNNPVGTVWIALAMKGYGIHGTPDPSKVGKSASQGCVRLTNWDVSHLAGMVRKGMSVTFLDD